MGKRIFWAVFTLVASAIGAALAAIASSRSLVIALAGVGTVALRARTTLGLLVMSILTLGLVRRLLSGGRVDNDPLLLIPVGLLIFACAKSIGVTAGARRQPAVSDYALLGLVLLPLLSWATSPGRNSAGLYTASLFASVFATILVVQLGLLPDIREALLARAPLATLLLSAYGLAQFFILPAWDRNWMVATRLDSIGRPFPGELRVFGTLESPGPYAMVLGSLILLTIHALSFRKQSRVVSIMALIVGIPALFLTGVRTGLVGLALVTVIAAVKTRRFGIVGVGILGGAAVYYVASAVLGSNSDSNVFVSDRYSTGNLGQDHSLQQRLLLLDQIGPALRSGLGVGWSGARADSLYVDALISAGVIVGFLCLAIAMLVAAKAVAYDWRRPDAGFHLAAIYTLVFSVAGPILTTTSGMLVGLCWGWVLASRRTVEVPKSEDRLGLDGQRHSSRQSGWSA